MEEEFSGSARSATTPRTALAFRNATMADPEV